MEEKREAKQEQLIRELHDRLKWFTFEATEKEFDTEQVQAILERLDTLDPIEAEQKNEAEIAAMMARFEEMKKQG